MNMSEGPVQKLAKNAPDLLCPTCEARMDQTQRGRTNETGTAVCTRDGCPERDIVYTYEWPQITLTRREGW